MVDVAAELAPVRDELLAAMEEVLESGQFILGANVEAFEREAASFLGARHVVGLSSGTDALMIGLRALGVGPGDEVITTPLTFFATAEVITLVGARPVFVDIDPETYNLDPDLVAAHLSSATRAILPVHLYGHPAPMGDLLELARAAGVAVLEDAAQAFGGEWKGRRLGTIGGAGAFSFYPSKNLAACGDAGLLATDDDTVDEMARMLRQHGSHDKYEPEVVGYNARLDELQAAILRVKLGHVEARNARRREIAARYNEELAGIGRIRVPPMPTEGRAVFHQYTLRVVEGGRDDLKDQLAARGVPTRVYYPVPLHRLPVYSEHPPLPHAERAALEVLSLPIWPEMRDDQVQRVADAVRACTS